MDHKDELIKALQTIIEMQKAEIERLKSSQIVINPQTTKEITIPSNPWNPQIVPFTIPWPPIVTCGTNSNDNKKEEDASGKEQVFFYGST